MIVQTWVIAYLVLYYGGQTAAALAYSAAVVVILGFLTSSLAPASLLVFLQSTVVFNVAAARVSGYFLFQFTLSLFCVLQLT